MQSNQIYKLGTVMDADLFMQCIFFPTFFLLKIPMLNIQVKVVPALFTVAGTIFSSVNYFRVIFTGGVGKNGSTIAVSF